jgi:hypothetical protein
LQLLSWVERRGAPLIINTPATEIALNPATAEAMRFFGAVSRCLGLLPDGEAGARRRRSCVVCRSPAGCEAGSDSAWMRFFPGLDLSPCFSPLVTKPLWTFGFSDYEVWVTVPPPAWSKQIKDRLNGVAPYRYPPATSSRFSPAPFACSSL